MSTDPLSLTFAALADPTRRAILARLSQGESSVKELAEPFAKVLERAGLITRGKEAQWRPCRLDPGPLQDVSEWLEHYSRFWDQSLGRLDEMLRTIKAKPPDKPGL